VSYDQIARVNELFLLPGRWSPQAMLSLSHAKRLERVESKVRQDPTYLI
jgi:hypothetical protein